MLQWVINTEMDTVKSKLTWSRVCQVPGCSVKVDTPRASALCVKLALRVDIETLLPILAVGKELTRNLWMRIRTIVSIPTVGPKTTSLIHTPVVSILLLLLCRSN